MHIETLGSVQTFVATYATCNRGGRLNPTSQLLMLGIYGNKTVVNG